MSLCSHCGTVVMFEKEDFVKFSFQNGKKIFMHLECFQLKFLRVDTVKGVINEVENTIPDVRVGSLDPQGNLFLGVDDDLIQSTVVI